MPKNRTSVPPVAQYQRPGSTLKYLWGKSVRSLEDGWKDGNWKRIPQEDFFFSLSLFDAN